MRTPEDTAVLIALLLKRSEQKRARVSMNTVRRLSKRKHIRGAFVAMLEQHLDGLGIILVEVDRGGFGVIPSSALEGAPAITAKRYLEADLDRLKRDGTVIDRFRAELHGELGWDDEEDA